MVSSINFQRMWDVRKYFLKLNLEVQAGSFSPCKYNTCFFFLAKIIVKDISNAKEKLIYFTSYEIGIFVNSTVF